MSWADVDRLISEQKFEAASKAVTAIRERAREAGDAGEWTRALVEETKLRMALHGYETAVRFLRAQPWPEEAVSQAVLELYYANSLATYARVYSWEIRQRERVETSGELDLKAWDLERIVEEADRAYFEVWSQRGEWGSEPLGGLARYIQQNNYPPRIRGALRDAVTYLWIELLADTSLWSPAESNDVFRLDAAALIAGDPESSAAVALDNPAVHPLVKISALLDDLEAWHAAGDRPEAALEARLERLRRLHAALDSTADRLAIRRHLEIVQEGFDSAFDWWSMGQATLAEFIRSESDTDALVRARAVAIAGRDRHPGSIGGQRCANIAASIEAASYSLAAMATDGAGRRSIQINHRNVPAVYFRAYRYDLFDFIEGAEDYNLQPHYREAEEIMAGVPDAEWMVELPPTPDYRSCRRVIAVPRTPGNARSPPVMLTPATRPVLFATVARCMFTEAPVTRCSTSAQSPAAHTPSIRVRWWSSTATAPVSPSGMPASRASSTTGREPIDSTTTSAGIVSPSNETPLTRSVPSICATIAPVSTAIPIARTASAT